jgi:hypothetical protein
MAKSAREVIPAAAVALTGTRDFAINRSRFRLKRQEALMYYSAGPRAVTDALSAVLSFVGTAAATTKA